MSEDIYDDVIGTESKGMSSERVEMMVEIYESADAVRDHDFRTETNTHQPLQQTGSDGVRIRSSRAAAVCLGLLCVLLLTAVIVLCVHIQTKSTNYTQEREQLLNKITNFTQERDQLLTKITNFTEEREQLLTKITNFTQERDQLLNKITNFTEERDQLLNKNINLTNESHVLLNQINNLTKQRDQLKETNELWKSEMDRWIYYNYNLYFISSEMKSWTESRRYCTERGADLIIINNTEEQDFVKNMSNGVRVWIGLTDSVEEGRWTWVDGSTLTSSFWMSGEPNGRTTENCTLTQSSRWADYPCNDRFKWICEKIIKKSN